HAEPRPHHRRAEREWQDGDPVTKCQDYDRRRDETELTGTNRHAPSMEHLRDADSRGREVVRLVFERGQWPGEEEALRLIAPELVDPCQLAHRLHPFGDHGQGKRL